jgi:hypothetical protein
LLRRFCCDVLLNREKATFLMNDAKNDVPVSGELKTAPDSARAARKVRSSRYEWENKSNENEHQPDAQSAGQRSLFVAIGKWIKRHFLGDRDLFDNDDDASPSAA